MNGRATLFRDKDGVLHLAWFMVIALLCHSLFIAAVYGLVVWGSTLTGPFLVTVRLVDGTTEAYRVRTYANDGNTLAFSTEDGRSLLFNNCQYTIERLQDEVE